MSKKKRRTEARTQPRKADNSPQKQNHLRTWILGITATVMAGVLTAALLWIGPEIIDSAAAKDAVRDATGYDDEIRHTVEYLDPGFDLVLPREVELTARQKEFLSNWSLDYQDPSGYDFLDLFDELRSVGGANPNELMLSITLEGRRNQPIRVDNIRPINIHHRDPYDGTFLNVPPQEPGETVKIMFNFDEFEPRARTAVDRDGSGEYKPGGLFFQEQTLTVNDAKQDTIFLKSTATRWAVTFDIRIDYRIGDERNHLLIDNDGHPFALTPMNCVDHTQLDPEGTPLASGDAAYQHIWSLTGDFKGIEPVQDPTRFEIGYPYC